MAGARLEKVGTIFARVNSMLKKNVLPAEDKPIWYEIYALHPPHYEPRHDQEAPTNDVREILYEEDIIRAKFHDRITRYETINLSDNKYESKTKRFIDLYRHFQAQGALDDEKIFQVALEQLNAKSQPKSEELMDEINEFDEPVDYGLAKSFAEAMEQRTPAKEIDNTSKKDDKKTASIDIKSLF